MGTIAQGPLLGRYWTKHLVQHRIRGQTASYPSSHRQDAQRISPCSILHDEVDLYSVTRRHMSHVVRHPVGCAPRLAMIAPRQPQQCLLFQPKLGTQ